MDEFKILPGQKVAKSWTSCGWVGEIHTNLAPRKETRVETMDPWNLQGAKGMTQPNWHNLTFTQLQRTEDPRKFHSGTWPHTLNAPLGSARILPTGDAKCSHEVCVSQNFAIGEALKPPDPKTRFALVHLTGRCRSPTNKAPPKPTSRRIPWPNHTSPTNSWSPLSLPDRRLRAAIHGKLQVCNWGSSPGRVFKLATRSIGLGRAAVQTT